MKTAIFYTIKEGTRNHRHKVPHPQKHLTNANAVQEELQARRNATHLPPQRIAGAPHVLPSSIALRS